MDNSKSKGLGDTIEKITKSTGLKAIVDKISEVTKTPCGCGQRKDTLNKMFPYKKTERIKQDWKQINGKWKLIKTKKL